MQACRRTSPHNTNRMPLAWTAGALLAAVVLLPHAWSSLPLAAEAVAAPVEARAEATIASRLLAEAQRIVANTRKTWYGHKTEVDEPNGAYGVDCSGLATYLLKRVSRAHLVAVPKGEGRAHPLALDFYRAFASASTEEEEGRWRRIERLADARPGDFLAWCHDPPKPGSTGHVLLIAEAPVLEEDAVAKTAGGAPAKGRLWRLVVIDSTSSPHGQDTRKAEESGVGRGTMWFEADEAGRPRGYRWSRAGGTTHIEPIVMGRAR
jgi:hypothetical protein